MAAPACSVPVQPGSAMIFSFQPLSGGDLTDEAIANPTEPPLRAEKLCG